MRITLVCVFVLVALSLANSTTRADEPWIRHIIDNGHRGADGVRLGDFNHDGRPDIVTGWEESGLVKLYLNPGPERSNQPWPAATIGKAESPEDAVPIDVDGDGELDVVSCHEGKRRQLLVHWNETKDARSPHIDLLSQECWSSDRFEQLDGVMWMFATPLGIIDSRVAIVVGAKGPDASITLLLSPRKNKRDLASWTEIRLRDAGWIMSIRSIDMDADGDNDIVFSDRKGNDRVTGWLEQPETASEPWTEHEIAGRGKEVMFLTSTAKRCLISMRESIYLDCDRTDDGWNVRAVANPKDVINGKAIEMLPDGRVILTSNTAASPTSDLPGIWIRDQTGNWSVIDPTTRVKFDRMELIDLDADGDLDVLTCEERRNLGVVWYENPDQG